MLVDLSSDQHHLYPTAEDTVMTCTTIQEATISALEALTDPTQGITVEAWAMRWPVTEACAHDELHGKGSCYGPTGDALCLACQIAWVQDNIVAGWMVSIEVAA